METVKLVLIVLCTSLPADGATKMWTQNTNFDNARNWDVGRVPCEADSVSFTAKSPAVFIEGSVRTASVITLPLTGEIVLGDGSFIAAVAPASGQGQSVCEGEEVKFNRTQALNWLDPANWQHQEEPAQLDTERVPCVHDDVKFPTDSTFLVTLDSEVKVKSLTVSGVALSSQSLAHFLQTDGQFNLTESAHIHLSNTDCLDPTGCPCGNDRGTTMQDICAFQAQRCAQLNCDSGVTPRGHCCPVCGVVLTLDFTNGFKFNKFYNKIRGKFFGQRNDDAYMILSKTSADRIQLVVLDRDNSGELAKTRGHKLQDYIERDINGPKKLGLVSLHVQESGGAHSPSTGARTHKPFFHSSGSIAGVVISGIVLLLIIAGVMYCLVDRDTCRRRLPLSLPNPFRRYSTSSEKNSLEMDDTISYADVTRSDDELNTFENPMYNTPATSKPSVQQLVKHKQDEAVTNNNESPAVLDPSSVTFVKASEVSGGGSTSFSNPLFGKRKAENLSFVDPNLRLNPVYSEEGVEDSHI